MKKIDLKFRDNGNHKLIMPDLHRDVLEMVDRLYKDGKYREAIEGLRLLRDANMFEEESSNVEFKKKIDGMITLCLTKLRAKKSNKL